MSDESEVIGVSCDEFGPPDRLRVGPVRVRSPRSHEVVIDVVAAGANFVDGLMVSGTYQIKPELPFVPGGEMTGLVTSAGGPEGSHLVGKFVLAMTLYGGMAQRAVVRAVDCVVLPDRGDGVDLYALAGFAESYSTARFALMDRANLRPGERVVVTGAGSGVGFAAVHLAATFGASVVAVASSEAKRRAALAAGAEHAVEPGVGMKDAVRTATGGDADVIFDVVGGSQSETLLRLLGFGGRYVTVGFASGEIPSLPLNHVLLRNRSVVGAELGSWARRFGTESGVALAGLVALVAEGRLTLPAPVRYSLLDAPSAFDALLSRNVVGRIVIDVDATRPRALIDRAPGAGS